MPTLAAALVDTSALWKIIAVSFAGGAGIVIAFGFVLLGTSRFEEDRNRGLAARAGWGLLVLLAAAFCIAAVIIGFLAMTKK